MLAGGIKAAGDASDLPVGSGCFSGLSQGVWNVIACSGPLKCPIFADNEVGVSVSSELGPAGLFKLSGKLTSKKRFPKGRYRQLAAFDLI